MQLPKISVGPQAIGRLQNRVVARFADRARNSRPGARDTGAGWERRPPRFGGSGPSAPGPRSVGSRVPSQNVPLTCARTASRGSRVRCATHTQARRRTAGNGCNARGGRCDVLGGATHCEHIAVWPGWAYAQTGFVPVVPIFVPRDTQLNHRFSFTLDIRDRTATCSAPPARVRVDPPNPWFGEGKC
jgi:hypothetical protein